MHIPPSSVAAGPATATTIPSTLTYNALSWISKQKGGGGGYTENWSSLIGIITAIIGNVLISFALNMQRYAHIRLDREWQEKERQRKKRNASSLSLNRLAEETAKMRRGEGEATESDPLISRLGIERGDSVGSGVEEEAYKQQSYLKSPYWWFGIILMTVGEAGNFLAYGFAPASIVSPLGVVALISNCIIAPFMLKEPFRKRDALGVIIAVGGAVTVVLSANDNNPKLGPGEIWDLIRRWEFETYLGITVGVIALLMVASNRYGGKSILIDLGLVGLFGMSRPQCISFKIRPLTSYQAAIPRFPQRASLRYCPTRSGVPSLSQYSICWSLSLSLQQSCRSSTSIGHSSDSTLRRSSPFSSSSSHYQSSVDPQSSTVTSNAHPAKTPESL
jgi:hypothetical protein